MTTLWDESYPPSLFAPVIIPIASVAAGTPGAFAPGNAPIPATIAALRADAVVGNAGTNKPGAAWTTGQYVVLGDASHAYWDGAAWQTGNAPAPLPPAPTLTGVAPNTGAAAGGTVTALTGTNFTGATGVTFGGVAGTAFAVTNATTIAVTSPAHAAGAVAVVVQHPSGNATQAGGFTYA